MHSHASIDSYAYASKLKHWNAFLKVGFAITVICMVIGFQSWTLSFFTFVYMSFITVVLGGIRIRDYLHLLLIPVTFILLCGLTLLFQFGDQTQAIWQMPWLHTHLYISQVSLQKMLQVTMNALGAVSALYFLSLSTPMGEILGVLKKLHIPKMMLELMFLIYRYIFVLLEIHHHQREASRARLGYEGFHNAIHTFGMETANLLIMSLKKSDHYYDAMTARGYEGEGLFYQTHKKMGGIQIGSILLYLCIAVLVRRI